MDKATKRINSAKDLSVYKKAYALAMEIFNISKEWPSEEKFFPDRSDQAVFTVRMCEFEGGMGKKKISGSFYQQIDRFGWRKQRNRYLA